MDSGTQPSPFGSPEENRARADSWLELAKTVAKLPDGVGWGIVILFYAALHYTRARLIELGVTPASSHQSSVSGGQRQPGQNDLVSRHIPQIQTKYFNLYETAYHVRYRFTSEEGLRPTFDRAYSATLEIRNACSPND